MKTHLFLYILLLTSLGNIFSQAPIMREIYNGKAYKEAKNIEVTNVNNIIKSYEDGLKFNYLSNRKTTFTKINSGRKDFEGNTIFYVKIVDNKTQDSVILYPKYEWYPTEYYAEYYYGNINQYAFETNNNHEYFVRAVDRKIIYGKNPFYLKPVDKEIAEALEEKIEYDRKDLIERDAKKRFDGYNAYLKRIESDLSSKAYLTEIDAILSSDFIYCNGYESKRTKLKVEKIKDANNNIKEIKFMFPFTDGSYPDKDEFIVRAFRDKNNMLVITNGKGALNDGTLLPFDNCVFVTPTTIDKRYGYFYKSVISTDPFEYKKMDWLLEYTREAEIHKKKEYEELWKLSNVTEKYDPTEKYKFENFLKTVILSHYLK